MNSPAVQWPDNQPDVPTVSIFWRTGTHSGLREITPSLLSNSIGVRVTSLSLSVVVFSGLYFRKFDCCKKAHFCCPEVQRPARGEPYDSEKRFLTLAAVFEVR